MLSDFFFNNDISFRKFVKGIVKGATKDCRNYSQKMKLTKSGNNEQKFQKQKNDTSESRKD